MTFLLDIDRAALLDKQPCINIRRAGSREGVDAPTRVRQVEILGPSSLKYCPEKPKPYGPSLWVETHAELHYTEDGHSWSYLAGERRGFLPEIIILIVTTDDYLKAFGEVWWSCFREYWSCCNYKTYATAPHGKHEYMPIINTPDEKGWNRRTLQVVRKLQADYNPEAILLLHEDFLPGPQKRIGDFNRNLERCLDILRKEPDIRSIGLVHKDPETKPYEGWPEMLGWHDVKTQGVLPVDPAGISLWRTTHLVEHLEEVIKVMPPEKDYGRQGVVEFSFYGSEWSKERDYKHLRVKREIPYKDGIINILFGVSIEQGKLAIKDKNDLAWVEYALKCPLSEIKELQPLLSGKVLDLAR